MVTQNVKGKTNIRINFWAGRVAQDHGKSADSAKTPAAKNEATAVKVSVIPSQ